MVQNQEAFKVHNNCLCIKLDSHKQKVMNMLRSEKPPVIITCIYLYKHTEILYYSNHMFNHGSCNALN